MLGALILSTLALSGQSDPLWVSSAAPRAGTDYIAISWTGGGEFGCGAAIGRTAVETVVYKLTDPAVTVLVFRIPKDAAGKRLSIGFSVTTRETNRITAG